MKPLELQGKRYIGLLRCSTRGQAATSIDDQRRLLDAYAREQDMVCVDYISLEGVSGSLPGNRDDVQQLIARKRERDDFDILLVQDSSRLTRAGTQHAHRLESDLNTVGIDVVFVADSIPDGHVGDLVKSVVAFANQHHAEMISLGSARGSMSSILDGRSPYCRRPPYGLDRLYIAPDGRPSHIIRNLPDGRQLKLHPETHEVTGEFGVNERSGVPNHYIKQKQERVQLVLGDPRCVEVVRQVYRRHFVDGWGAYRIATELNEGGVPSPAGKKWNTHTIAQILKNSVYRGIGIANRYTAAVYHMRSQDRPIEAKVSKQELYTRRRPARRVRAREEWRTLDNPQVAGILDEEIRDLAAAKQESLLEYQASKRPSKPNRDRHRDSSFFLKGILNSRQGNQPMTGVTTGNKKSKKRYYRVSRAFSMPDGDRVMRHLVPADPLEHAILALVKETLLNLPDLRERIEDQVRAEIAAAGVDTGVLPDLLRERDEIGRKLKLVVERFDPEMQALIDEELTSLRARLKSLNHRIAQCGQAKPASEAEIGSLVDRTVAAIHDLAATLSGAPPATLRQLLSVLISRLVVDLETRDVELEIALPAGISEGQARMCLVEGLACKSSDETHRVLVATCAGSFDRKRRRYCGSCRRSAA